MTDDQADDAVWRVDPIVFKMVRWGEEPILGERVNSFCVGFEEEGVISSCGDAYIESGGEPIDGVWTKDVFEVLVTGVGDHERVMIRWRDPG